MPASQIQNSKSEIQNFRLTLVGGKGGVGKTTVAAALAVARADRGEKVVVVSVDPAHSLGDALGAKLGPDPLPLPELPALSALEIDADLERARFLGSHRGALLALLERGTYLDEDDATGLVDLTVPGIDELAALFRLQQLCDSGTPLIVDTAPTGHTLRLLDLPDLARGWLDALRAMEDRSRAVSTALVGSYQPDEGSELLVRLEGELGELSSLLRDPLRTRFILVTSREPVALAETMRYQEELSRRRIVVGGLVVNRASPDRTPSPEGVPMVFVPVLAEEPVGLPALRSYAAHFLPDPSLPAVSPRETRGGVRAGRRYTPPLHHSLYLVSGKGGVGKSTTAAALAVRLHEEGRTVLLLGVDPAGSLGEVLDAPIDAGAGEIEIAAGLFASQLDPTSAWESFRSGYRSDAERIFSGLLGTVGSAGDRDVITRLVDLAPPGIDELAALVEVVDASEDRPYDAVVVDTAPTGHFLRLLQLPDLALEWTHQAMRLLLKYREVVAPGEVGARLLTLAKSLRAFRERLRDPDRSWLLVVALPEELSLQEGRRLLDRLAGMSIPAGALLINRLIPARGSVEVLNGAAAELIRLAGAIPVFAAPALTPGPVGVGALSSLAREWVEVQLTGQENSD